MGIERKFCQAYTSDSKDVQGTKTAIKIHKNSATPHQIPYIPQNVLLSYIKLQYSK